jgi:hypothetical protein
MIYFCMVKYLSFHNSSFALRYFLARPQCDTTLVSEGRPEGSKRNLKFQSATWHHFKHFQSKDFFFLLPFFHNT